MVGCRRGTLLRARGRGPLLAEAHRGRGGEVEGIGSADVPHFPAQDVPAGCVDEDADAVAGQITPACVARHAEEAEQRHQPDLCAPTGVHVRRVGEFRRAGFPDEAHAFDPPMLDRPRVLEGDAGSFVSADDPAQARVNAKPKPRTSATVPSTAAARPVRTIARRPISAGLLRATGDAFCRQSR